MARHKEGQCQICKVEYEAFTSAYGDSPFIDGKKYVEICHCCSEVPRMWELRKNYDDGYAVHKEYVYVYDSWDMDRLHSVASLMDDGGWDKEDADRSVRAVKKAVAAAKKKAKEKAEKSESKTITSKTRKKSRK